ncbi:hypothetical protein EGT07_01270 [Herbaspirillum sp. HC18]|nr:hypothetical protein EGT07_01270 [Herbaspirillum sp. HC18]
MRSSSISGSPPFLGSPPAADRSGGSLDPDATLARLSASSSKVSLNKDLFEGQQVYVAPFWLQQQTRHLGNGSKTLIGRALQVLHNGTSEDKNYSVDDRRGDFELADKSGGADHAVFQHDPDGNLCFLSVRAAELDDGEPARVLAEIGVDAEAANAPCSSGLASRSPSPHPLQKGWRAGTSASHKPMSDGSDSDDSVIWEDVTYPSAGQKRKPPFDHGGRLVDGQRPGSPPEPTSRRSSIDSTYLDGFYDSLLRDSDASRAASPIADVPAGSPEAANPIEAVQRQPANPAQRKAFEAARLACMSELVKYFSDRELAGLKRTGVSTELLVQRARACGASENVIDKLSQKCRAWLNGSKTAISDIREDDPFFFNANGKPMDAGLIQFNRAARCGDVQPLAIRPSEEVAQANRAVEKRFMNQVRARLNLDEKAGTSEVRRKDRPRGDKFMAATAFTTWAINNDVNLTELSLESLNLYKEQFAARLQDNGTEPAAATVNSRKHYIKLFIDFLATEYVATEPAATDDGPTTAPPGPHPS